MPDAEGANLEALVEKWQRILRLRDWRISVRWAESEEMENNSGSCRVHNDGKMATIKVLAPSAYNPTSDMYKLDPPDTEQIVVHEMLHIHFDMLMNHDDPSDHEQTMQEQAIEFISQALVERDRA